ncbi:MAG: RNA 2',3'-cyclic phosphodiesterase [Desulfovibrio sp.]|nr:RNA 2',3'-cyclic phosphodiesterase [Desulfovibrio sp.]
MSTIPDAKDALVRAFVAVNVSEPAASELERFLDGLKPLARLRWVSREQFHITLRFLGEQTQQTIERVKGSLRHVQFAPFEVALSYGGAFPGIRKPYVLWLSGKHGMEHLSALAEDVNNAIDHVGLPREKRAFKPHLTLARTDGTLLPPALLTKLENPPIIAWRCEGFELMRSRLTPRGAVYSKIPLSE